MQASLVHQDFLSDNQTVTPQVFIKDKYLI
jgi:hypothetical protein